MKKSKLSDNTLHFHIVIKIMQMLEEIINPKKYQYLITSLFRDKPDKIQYNIFATLRSFNIEKMLKAKIQLIEYDSLTCKIIKYHDTILELSLVEERNPIQCNHCGNTVKYMKKIPRVIWKTTFNYDLKDYKKINDIIKNLITLPNVNNYKDYKYIL